MEALLGPNSERRLQAQREILRRRGDVVAAVLIPAPRFRVSNERLQSLGESCLAAANKVTARLGGKVPGDGGTGSAGRASR